MKLEELLGEELYGQVKAKIEEANAKETDKLKHIRYADLSEGEYVSKGKFDTVSTEKTNLETQISTLNKTLKELQSSNKDNEDLQNTINTLNTDIKNLQKEHVNTIKSYALKEQLQKAGALDPDYLIYKAGGIDKFNFDTENNPIGVDDLIKPYKEDAAMAHLFKQEQKKQQYNPNDGGTGSTANPFAKETFNLTKQGELFKSSPEQAKALAMAAGVII